MKETFFAAIKLVSGEELISKVQYHVEGEEEFFIFIDPLEILEVGFPGLPVQGLKVIPWMKISNQTIFLVNKDKLITIIEVDESVKTFYKSSIDKINNVNKKIKLTEELGFKGTIEEARELLEKIYKKDYSK